MKPGGRTSCGRAGAGELGKKVLDIRSEHDVCYWQELRLTEHVTGESFQKPPVCEAIRGLGCQRPIGG